MKVCRIFFLILSCFWGYKANAATYAFNSDTFSWETASNNVVWDQTNTSYPKDDDKQVINFSGGFTFTFGGISYSSVRIISNGALQFGSDSKFHQAYNNTNLPIAGHDRLIMMYWDDINPGAGGTVRWEQKGSAPNRYFVVSWENVPLYSLGGSYTFQVILYENGEFKFQYGAGNATGTTATIGVEVSDTDYTLYSYNNSYGTNGTAIRWFKPSTLPSNQAFYRFEELPWSGAAQEIRDNSGNGFHGSRLGSAQVTSNGKVCQAANIPANTSSSVIDAVNATFDLDATIGNKGSISFWYYSNAAWSGSTSQLLDATTANNRWFFLTKDSNGKLNLVMTDSAGTTISAITGVNSIAAGTWKHITVSWFFATSPSQTVLKIYIDGVLAAISNAGTSGNLDASLGSLYIGDNHSSFIKSTGTGTGSGNSANGRIDEVRIYNYEITSGQISADMSTTHSCALDIVVGSFNAVDKNDDAVSGKIHTKIAGSTFDLDLVSLNSAHSETSFSGDVLVDLQANNNPGTTLDAYNCPISATTLAVGTRTFAGSRLHTTFPATANSWRDVRVRIRYPATGTPSIIICSTDNFAIRPASLTNVAVTDDDWKSAGSSRPLNNSDPDGGIVHKAGHFFSLSAQAVNSTGDITTNYMGTPTLAITGCVLPVSGCVLGLATTTGWASASGQIATNSARYDEVGTITATLSGTDYAFVDNADGTSDAELKTKSSVFTIGRFVPDSFEVTANVPHFKPGCGSFSYLGQPFGLGIAPIMTVTAKNNDGNTTYNYTGNLWHIPADGNTITDQTWTDASGNAVAPTGTLPSATVTPLSAGQGTVSFSIGDPLAGGGLYFDRTTIISPFEASLTLSANIADSDGVTYESNPYDFENIGFDDNNLSTSNDAQIRYGRINLNNAHGSEILDLAMPLLVEYYDGTNFITNTDDGCSDTTISITDPVSTDSLMPADSCVWDDSSTSGGFKCAAAAPAGTTYREASSLSAGNFNLNLMAPGKTGALDISATVDNWLQFDWHGTGNMNPSARATFGIYKGNEKIIYFREVY